MWVGKAYVFTVGVIDICGFDKMSGFQHVVEKAILRRMKLTNVRSDNENVNIFRMTFTRGDHSQ